jgi:hypothetical protein
LQRIALAKPPQPKPQPKKASAPPAMFDIPKIRSWLVQAASAA